MTENFNRRVQQKVRHDGPRDVPAFWGKKNEKWSATKCVLKKKGKRQWQTCSGENKERKKDRPADSQLSDTEAAGEAVFSHIDDVIITQIQGLQVGEVSETAALHAANLIMVPVREIRATINTSDTFY